jgi:hypothetical protein
MGRGLLSLCLLGVAATLVGGCGGSEQSKGEPTASFPVQIVHASFPTRQAVPHATQLMLSVRNPGPKTIPNVAVTLDSFSYVDRYPNESAPQQPVWIVDEGPGRDPKPAVPSQAVDPPGSGSTAYVNTWALGRLAPHATATFVWHVTPVKSGVHRVDYQVSAGLAGNAHAQLQGGGVPAGHFTVAIAARPHPKHVNPATGLPAPGAYTPAGGI